MSCNFLHDAVSDKKLYDTTSYKKVDIPCSTTNGHETLDSDGCQERPFILLLDVLLARGPEGTQHPLRELR
jgi:hypothetical protein